MTRIIDTLAEISANYDVLLCDLWGCVHNGQTPFPAAVAALQAFRAGGGRVVLLTNSPRPRASVIAQLDRMGLPRDTWDEIVTSGDAAQAALMAGAVGTKVYHIGPEEHLGFFTDMAEDIPHNPAITRVPLVEAEGIVCTGPFDDMTETPEDYRATLLYAKTQGMKLLCANPDIVVDHGDKRIYCAGALAQAYDQMGGESLYFGKPHPPIYDLARSRIARLGRAVDESRILAVGDGIATDIKGAIGEGLDVLFVTGGLAALETATRHSPDPEKLAALVTREMAEPTFAIGKLR